MKKLIYTDNEGGLCVVIPSSKESVEKVLGPLSDEQYEAHVRERSIPADATGVRSVDDADLPATREFRNAWADITDASKVDVDAAKAKELKLKELRQERNAALSATDVEFTRALESGDAEALAAVKAKRQALRDATESLKAYSPSGAASDATLKKIRDLSTLKE
jgi:hypothetical protein